jgi:hypothetical protein
MKKLLTVFISIALIGLVNAQGYSDEAIKKQTIEVVKVKKRRVVLECNGRKSRVFNPTNVKLEPGHLFWLNTRSLGKRHIKWDDVVNYPMELRD